MLVKTLVFLFTGVVLAMPKPPQGSQHALLVHDLKGHVLYNHRSDVLLTPASIQKLITAAAAWLYLGKDWTFKTRIWLPKEKLKNGVLDGDLIIEFQGAPDLKREQLAKLIAGTGVRKINGHLLFHQDVFSGYPYGSGWSWDNLAVCYATASSAFVIDHNCVQGALYAQRARQKARVHIPDFQPISVTQEIRIVKKGTHPACQLLVRTQGINNYHLFGCVEENPTPLPLNFAIKDAQVWTKVLIEQLLQQHAIQLKGRVALAQRIPETYVQVAQQASLPLDVLLTDMLQQSDNLIAENVLRVLGRLYFNQNSSSLLQGVRAIQEILKTRVGVDLSDASLHDGSGLSQHNLLSAQHVMQVLTVLQQIPAFDLKNRLAIGFESGSLRYRRSLSKYPLKGRVYAKSGSLENVSNLAGLVDTPHGQRLFVLFVNGAPKSQAKQVHRFERDILRAVVNMPNPDYQMTRVDSHP